jgi:hypothetical protein
MQALTWVAPGRAELGWLLGVTATLGLALTVMGAVRMLRLGEHEPDGERTGLPIRRLRPYTADIVLPVDPHPPQ